MTRLCPGQPKLSRSAALESRVAAAGCRVLHDWSLAQTDGGLYASTCGRQSADLQNVNMGGLQF